MFVKNIPNFSLIGRVWEIHSKPVGVTTTKTCFLTIRFSQNLEFNKYLSCATIVQNFKSIGQVWKIHSKPVGVAITKIFFLITRFSSNFKLNIFLTCAKTMQNLKSIGWVWKFHTPPPLHFFNGSWSTTKTFLFLDRSCPSSNLACTLTSCTCVQNLESIR